MSRLNDLLQQAGGIGRNPDGSITRLGFSEGYFQAAALLRQKMEELGLETEMDPVGNLHGVLPGTAPEAKSIVLGSHIDTVIQGGVYDGMLGVTGAIEVAARLKDEGRKLRHTLEIWGFNMEESSILGGTFGSRCVVGMVPPATPSGWQSSTAAPTRCALPAKISAVTAATWNTTSSRATSWITPASTWAW